MAQLIQTASGPLLVPSPGYSWEHPMVRELPASARHAAHNFEVAILMPLYAMMEAKHPECPTLERHGWTTQRMLEDLGWRNFHLDAEAEVEYDLMMDEYYRLNSDQSASFNKYFGYLRIPLSARIHHPIVVPTARAKWSYAPRPENDTVVFTSELLFEEHYKRLRSAWMSMNGGLDPRPGTAIDQVLHFAAGEALHVEQRLRELLDSCSIVDTFKANVMVEAKELPPPKSYSISGARLFIGGKEIKPLDGDGSVIYEPAMACSSCDGEQGDEGAAGENGEDPNPKGPDYDDIVDATRPVEVPTKLVPLDYPRIDGGAIAKSDQCYMCASKRARLMRFCRAADDSMLVCETCLRVHLGWEIDHTNKVLKKVEDI